MKENEVKIGQTVYFQEHWSGVIQDAKVMDIHLWKIRRDILGRNMQN